VHLFYLHGFASSAASTKAAFLADRLAPLGLPLHVPDFNEPAFETLTTSRMIQQVHTAVRALPDAPVVLIGSSLGAFVAWHAAAQAQAVGRPVHGLVLLAPALDFGRRRMTGLTDLDIEGWRTDGSREFFHYGYGGPRRVHYALYEDAQQYDSETARVDAPTLVLMGQRDEVVPSAGVKAFCATRSNITLVMLDDEHQLAGHLDRIWSETASFLGLPRG
jgi:hypothetical protein